MVWQKNPKLFYLGAQDQWFTFNMFDAQAWYVRDLIMGRTELPSAEQRAAHIEVLAQPLRRPSTATPTRCGSRRTTSATCIAATDYPMFDLDEVVRIFLEWKNDKKENILTYRDKPHRSVMTGTMAAEHHTPWLNELDDSLERYLSTPEATEVEQIVRGRASAGGAAADATTGDRTVTKA